MGVQLIARTGSSGASTYTTPSMDTTGASLLVLVVSYVATVTPTISDSKSNTWTALTAKSVSGQQSSRIYYAANPTVGSGHTFTVTGSSILSTGIAFAFSGITASSPFDQENGASLAGSGTTLSCGSITPSVNGELIIAGFSSGASSATLGQVAIDPRVTSVMAGATTIDTVGGVSYMCSVAFGIQGTAAAINPQWVLTGTGINANATAVIASFKPSATVSGGGAFAFAG